MLPELITPEDVRQMDDAQLRSRIAELYSLVAQMHDNHLALRRNFIAALASQQALMEQLEERGILDAERWRRDKLRYTVNLEQEAARKDEEAVREQGEDDRQWKCRLAVMRNTLKKYINHVGNCEGVTFIPEHATDDVRHSGQPFDQEELALLHKLRAELND